MNATKTESRVYTARMQPFSTGPIGQYRYILDGDRILVWDAVAGHYTACHALSDRTTRRLIKLAQESR